MARTNVQLTEAVNSDSFLDIVASVVSIMIIMVVMEGMRIKNTPVTTAIRGDPQAADLHRELAGEQSVREDVLKADKEVRQLQQWSVARGIQRDMLLTTVATLEKKVEEHRQELDQQKRQDFDRARAVAEAQSQLDQLAKEREQAEVSETAPVVLESYSTPIGRVVEKYEVHFILWGGKIAYIPMDVIEKQFVAAAQRKIYGLREDSPPVTETIGPFEGFKIRYTLEMKMKAGRPEFNYQLELKPATNLMGETVDQSLSEGSAFRGQLAKLRRGVHTVTIHVYSDSFDGFRQIRKELYHLGFAVAARPLAPGMLIGISNLGTKSTAE